MHFHDTHFNFQIKRRGLTSHHQFLATQLHFYKKDKIQNTFSHKSRLVLKKKMLFPHLHCSAHPREMLVQQEHEAAIGVQHADKQTRCNP